MILSKQYISCSDAAPQGHRKVPPRISNMQSCATQYASCSDQYIYIYIFICNIFPVQINTCPESAIYILLRSIYIPYKQYINGSDQYISYTSKYISCSDPAQQGPRKGLALFPPPQCSRVAPARGPNPCRRAGGDSDGGPRSCRRSPGPGTGPSEGGVGALLSLPPAARRRRRRRRRRRFFLGARPSEPLRCLHPSHAGRRRTGGRRASSPTR